MKALSMQKVLGVVVATSMCSLALVGCSATDKGESGTIDLYDVTGGVAASVNDHQIGELFITDYIDNFRTQQELTTDEAWAQWMVDFDMDPESVRKDIIDFYIDKEVIKVAAEQNEITIDEELINSQVSVMVSQYGSQEAWEDALASQGITEDDYRDMLSETITTQSLMDKVTPAREITEKQFLEEAPLLLSSYDGARKSSHILFSPEDKALAEDVLAQLKAGDISFEDAVEKYSTDEGSKADGGNVGWDKLASFVPEYTTALSPLEKGELSGLVQSDYGYHIIKCTDVFEMPETIKSEKDIPSDFVTLIKDQLSEYQRQSDFMEWRDKFKSECEIVINDMPADMPYDVDITGYTKSEPPAPQARDVETADAEVDAAKEDAEATDKGEDTATKDAE